MKVGKGDWAFKINIKTGNLEMHVPKKGDYTFEEITNVAIGLVRFSGSIGLLIDAFLADTSKKEKG